MKTERLSGVLCAYATEVKDGIRPYIGDFVECRLDLIDLGDGKYDIKFFDKRNGIEQYSGEIIVEPNVHEIRPKFRVIKLKHIQSVVDPSNSENIVNAIEYGVIYTHDDSVEGFDFALEYVYKWIDLEIKQIIAKIHGRYSLDIIDNYHIPKGENSDKKTYSFGFSTFI